MVGVAGIFRKIMFLITLRRASAHDDLKDIRYMPYSCIVGKRIGIFKRTALLYPCACVHVCTRIAQSS